MPWDEALLDEFYQDGVTCSKADHVILNLAGNGAEVQAIRSVFILACVA